LNKSQAEKYRHLERVICKKKHAKKVCFFEKRISASSSCGK